MNYGDWGASPPGEEGVEATVEGVGGARVGSTDASGTEGMGMEATRVQERTTAAASAEKKRRCRWAVSTPVPPRSSSAACASLKMEMSTL